MTTVIPQPSVNPIPYTNTFEADMVAFMTWLYDNAPKFGLVAAETNAALNLSLLGVTSSSTTSLTIGIGSKTLTVGTGLGYAVGMPLKIPSAANVNNYMKGVVTAYNSGTGSLTVNVASIGGSGTFADWAVFFDIPDAATPKMLTRNITSADTIVASDAGKLLTLSGTFTLGAAAAATLGAGFYCFARADGGTVTFDPNGSETVDGVTSGILRGAYILQCDGSAFTTVRLGGASKMEVITSGSSWVCPLGVRSLKYRLTGGGAGTDNGAGRAVGTAGGYSEGFMQTVPNNSYAYSIGAAGGTSSPCTGGTTTWNGTVSANGGTTANSNIADGGTATGGDLNIKGASCGLQTGSISIAGSTPLGNAGVANSSTSTIIDPTGYGSGAAIYSGAASKPGRPGVIILEY